MSDRLRDGRVLLVALAATAAGCGGSGSGTPPGAATSPPPSATSSAGASTTPTATPAPAAQLAALAARAGRATYTARYRLLDAAAGGAAVAVYRGARALRVDIARGGAVAVLLITPSGSYACRTAVARPTCFSVAGAGRPLPAVFDAGLQRVFSGYLAALAGDAGAYTVARAGTTPAGAGVPAGRCFSVRGGATAPAPRAAPGTYCLADDGTVTAARFPSGSLRLLRVDAGPPRPAALRPPARPTPLPS